MTQITVEVLDGLEIMRMTNKLELRIEFFASNRISQFRVSQKEAGLLDDTRGHGKIHEF